MDERLTTEGDVTSAGDVGLDYRRGVLELLAAQAGVKALCLDETITPCALTNEVVELGLSPFELGDGVSVPVMALRESDRDVAFAAILRARSHGVADAVVHRRRDDGDLIVHVVNMLDDWGVLIVLIGGTLRPLLGHKSRAGQQQMPRRLIHRRDRTGHMLWVDESTERLMGWTPDQMLGVSAIEFVEPADHERAIQGWIEMLSGGQPEHTRVRYLTASGERRWLEVTLTNLLDDPDYDYVEVELIDVHDEMVALSAAKFGEAQFGALTESLPIGVIQVGVNGEIVYSNKWVRDAIGVTDQRVCNWEGIAEQDRELVDRAFSTAITIGESTDVDVRMASAVSGQLRRCRLRIRTLGVDEDGSSRGAIASIEDMTETLELQARLHKQIRTDGLTDLPNRLALNEWLAENLHDDPDRPGVTVLYLDLDGFKHINDCYGHDAGDRLLRAIGGRAALALEPSDMLARIGGDEFVIARSAALDDEACARLAQRLLDIFDRSIDVDFDGSTIKLGCSIGIARSCSPHAVSSVLADADLAMYRAKHSGGSRWFVHDGGLSTQPGDAFAVHNAPRIISTNA